MAKKKQTKIVIQAKPAKKKTKQKTKNTTNPTLLGSALRSLGAWGGGALGTYFGNPVVGASAGAGLGAAISRWLGSGDYSVSSNSLVSRFKGSGAIPMMHSSNQSIVVRHREFVCDVISPSTSAYTISQTFPLNPGLEKTFPWLSTIANNFQEYSFKGVIFHYVPTSGDSVASTNTSLANVMLHTNYRSTDKLPQSKVELLNEYFACDSKASDSFCHPIECNPKENPYQIQYVRTGSVPYGEDSKTYDLGVTTLAISGAPASGVVLGELWVTYEVELKKPKASGFLNDGLSTCNVTSAYTSIPTNTTPLAFFNNPVAKIYDNSLGISVPDGSTITFPSGSAGDYEITVVFSSSASITTFTGAAFATANMTLVPRFNNNGSESSFFTAVGSSSAIVVFTVRITDPALVATAALTYTTFTYSGALVGSLLVSQVGRI